MPRKLLAPSLPALAAALAVATALEARAPRGGQAPSAAPVTFSEHVAPIVFEHCTSCHRPGEIAPFPLTSYADVRPRGRQIAAAVQSRRMPPWKAESDYPLRGDRRLSDREIALVERWVADGMLEGDPAKLPPRPAFPDGWQLGEPDLVVTMPEPFEVPASGRDIYRNFVLPLNLSEDVWVKAVEFRPSARAVVHHALFFLDATGAARARDERDPGPGYSGGMGGGVTIGAGGRLALSGTSAGGGTLGGWAPGAQPRLLPDDLAFFVPKGSDLIISTHFHPSGTAALEASTVGLYFAKEPPSKPFTAIQLPPLFGFFAGIDIPAGNAHYTIADSFVLPIAVRAWGVSGHAHYLGRSMRLKATLPSGEVRVLLSIPDWDFGWQEQYQFADYVDLPRGTRLDVTIAYDNSSANKRNPSTPPARVRWGEQSTDEMGSMTLQVVAADSGELPLLQQALRDHLRQAAAASPVGRLLLGLAAIGGR
jgi:mono/diheme cytochrome c family protein